jgi:hypothetical protein
MRPVWQKDKLMAFSKIMRLAFGFFALAFFTDTALAQTPRKQCSEKYQTAKAAGTLNGVAWPQFLSQCLAETKAEPEGMPAAATPSLNPAPTPAPAAQNPSIPNMNATPIVNKPPAGAMPGPAGAAPMGEAVFPKTINPAYANEKPGTARMKTCVDQYKINKATNSNGGMKWIQKGGGYYSECNKHLKG